MADSVLKLKCLEPADVDVVSALLQDALVRVRDLQYVADSKRFAGVLNRFRWELSDGSPAGENDLSDASYEDVPDVEPGEIAAVGQRQRIHCGLCFEHVKAVQSRNLPSNPEAFLSLLSIIAGPSSATLLFADKVSIKVSYTKLALFHEDLGEAWPTGWRPQHADDEPSK